MEKLRSSAAPETDSSSSRAPASEYHIPHVSLQNKAKTHGKAAISEAALAQARRGGAAPLGPLAEVKSSTRFRGISGNHAPSANTRGKEVHASHGRAVCTTVSNHRLLGRGEGGGGGGKIWARGSARRTGRQRDTGERPPRGGRGPGTRGAGRGWAPGGGGRTGGARQAPRRGEGWGGWGGRPSGRSVGSRVGRARSQLPPPGSETSHRYLALANLPPAGFLLRGLRLSRGCRRASGAAAGRAGGEGAGGGRGGAAALPASR